MKNTKTLPGLKGHRFPRSVIAYAVWAYFRFNMSLRYVEDVLSDCGIIVSVRHQRFWFQRPRKLGEYGAPRECFIPLSCSHSTKSLEA